MDVEKIRDVIAFALDHLQVEKVKVVPIGNRVHLYVGDEEFEVVVKTMNPKGSSRLDRPRLNPSDERYEQLRSEQAATTQRGGRGMGDDHRPQHGPTSESSSGRLQPQRSAAGGGGEPAADPSAKRRLEPNNLESMRMLIFDALEEPIGDLGCAGPPECTTCPGGVHDTGLGMFSGVIEVEIDEETYEIRVTKAKSSRSFSRKDLDA